MRDDWAPTMLTLECGGPGADAGRSSVHRRAKLRRMLVAALALLLCGAVALVVSDSAAGSLTRSSTSRSELEQILLETNASGGNTAHQDLAFEPSFYERFMQRLANLGLNSTEAQNATNCDKHSDVECVPAAATRISALQVTANLANDWVVRNPHDYHPYQFCAEFADLSAKELRVCLKHLMKPIELARSEPIAHNGTNSSVELALETNHTFNVSDEGGWDACYEAFEDETDKETCLTFVTNKLAGDLAYACAILDTGEQRLRCKRVTLAVDNVKNLIKRQEFVPSSNVTLARAMERERAIRSMRDEENKTETALQNMSPQLKDMLRKTVDMSKESNDELTAMEQTINATLLSGPQNVIDRLGPKPGPFGELPGQEEHEYMIAKALAANVSATAAAAEAAASQAPVDAVKEEMRAIIKRGYNGAGDAARALRLMKSPSGLGGSRVNARMAPYTEGGGEHASFKAIRAGQDATHTETLLQVWGGAGRSQTAKATTSAREEGLAQLEKLAFHGNLGDLDAIMDGTEQAPGTIVPKHAADDAKIAMAFGDDGTKFLRSNSVDAAVDSLGNALSSDGPTLHVPPPASWKSAADIASRFNKDSASNLMNLVDSDTENAGADASSVDDLAKVMEGRVPVVPVLPSREMQDAEAIAKSFNDDSVVASNPAANTENANPEQPAYNFDTAFAHIYKGLMSKSVARKQVRYATVPGSRSGMTVDGANVVDGLQGQQHPTEHAKTVSRQSRAEAVTRMPPKPEAKHDALNEQEESMDSLWKKLLDEEATAKAAKHEAQMAKKQAAVAAKNIAVREKVQKEVAESKEESKLVADEERLDEDRRAAAAAKREADLLAHKLAVDEMRVKNEKRTAAQSKAHRAALRRNRNEVAHQVATKDSAKVVRVEALQKAQNPEIEARTTNVKTSNPAIRGLASPDASDVAGQTTRDTEANIIVATVKQLEAKAEAEPVVTKQQRLEQHAEVLEAKKLLQQAALLRMQPYSRRQRAGASGASQKVPAVTSSRQPRKSSQVHNAHVKTAVGMLGAGSSGSSEREARSASHAVASSTRAGEGAKHQQHQTLGDQQNEIANILTRTASVPAGTSGSSSPAVVQSKVSTRAQVVQAVAPERAAVPASASTSSPAPARASSSSVRQAQAAAPVAATFANEEPAPHALMLTKAQQMEALIKKEDAAEEAKVSSLVKSIGDDDGLDDGLGLGNADSVSGMNRAAMAAKAAAADSDGSNLGNLMNMMSQSAHQNIAAVIKPYDVGSHHHPSQTKLQKRLLNTEGGGGTGKGDDVVEEAREVKAMSHEEDEEVKTMPGADAIERLKTLDAELKKHKAGLAEHLALEAKYKAQVAAARKKQEELEADNSGMFGLLDALQEAGSAGGALGSIIASGLSEAKKPNGKLPDVSKQFATLWKANAPVAGHAK